MHIATLLFLKIALWPNLNSFNIHRMLMTLTRSLRLNDQDKRVYQSFAENSRYRRIYRLIHRRDMSGPAESFIDLDKR